MKTILKTLVGSHAHGLANKNSDLDYRGVFIVPTNELLKLEATKKNVHWFEGKVDDTSWELGHFLKLATKSNPTILETFLAPQVSFGMPELKTKEKKIGNELRELFPYIWNSVDVKNAFIGYGHNQRKKLFEGKDNRPNKYAAAYLRVLYNAYELLSTGTFTVRIADTEVGDIVRKFKEHENALRIVDEIIGKCMYWEDKVKEAFEKNPDKKTDLNVVNNFLLKVRKNNW